MALDLARGFSLAVVEGGSFPMWEWAASAGAINLLTNDHASSELASDVRKSLDAAIFFGCGHGWTKRPRRSYRRFEADLPNECWQSDFTYYPLANGTDTEIISWLDDHARYALHCTVHTRITGTTVLDTFTHAITERGIPAYTLTDNGLVFTTHFLGGPNAF